MKKKFVAVFTTLCILAAFSACGTKEPAPVPEMEAPVIESPAPKAEEEPEGGTEDAYYEDTEYDYNELSLVDKCKKTFWYATRDWEVSPGWDEHSDVVCFQVADMFFWDGMSYEDLIKTLKNSEMAGELKGIYPFGTGAGGKRYNSIEEIPDTYEDWLALRNEIDEFNTFAHSFDIVSLPKVEEYYDEEETQYVSIGSGFLFVNFSNETGSQINKIALNQYDNGTPLDVAKRWGDPSYDCQGNGGFNPIMKAITRLSKDQTLTPVDFDLMLDSFENIPAGYLGPYIEDEAEYADYIKRMGWE